MRNVKILAAAGLMTMAGIAQADVSGTAAIVTDYDFRGFSQTLEEPALQGSIDYTSEGGWYAGLWGSNVSSSIYDDGANTASTELDVYTGFKGGDALKWDAGIVYYTYPGASDFNYFEIYGKLSYNVISGGLYYSDEFGGDSDESAYYVFADAGIPAGPVTIGLHAGLSGGDYWEELFAGTGEDTYMDYGVGVSYSASNFTLGFKWVAIDGGDAGSDDRVILSLSTALPWMQ